MSPARSSIETPVLIVRTFAWLRTRLVERDVPRRREFDLLVGLRHVASPFVTTGGRETLSRPPDPSRKEKPSSPSPASGACRRGKAKMKTAGSGCEERAERKASSGGAGFPAHPQERKFRRGIECAPATPSDRGRAADAESGKCRIHAVWKDNRSAALANGLCCAPAVGEARPPIRRFSRYAPR